MKRRHPRYVLRIWSRQPTCLYFLYFGFQRTALAAARNLVNAREYQVVDLDSNRTIEHFVELVA